ncbi:diphthine--ammonia ligase [Desulfobacterota bacterium AH_259_B03_O07]|nr:diphthine--ammonia ligase [Desulfobacterota bacterium AH_259_B03_O07]
MPERVLLSWSGGKDSALALYEINKSENFNIIALITTITDQYNRVSMHGIRTTLVEQQAKSIGLPLERILISKNASNNEYESKLNEVLINHSERGINSVVFGEIFLEDVKKYREDLLKKIGMKGVFPIWKRASQKLARQFIDLGFKAVITCIDSEAIDQSFSGREYNDQFLSDLPAEVDPCGENGEFHSFVYDGPIFKDPILHSKGDIVLRDNRFYYCDLLHG